jgi:4-hydroxy-tetrahydrodipicolinate reductase
MAIRIVVNGAAGRMGQEAVKAITATQDLILVAQTGRTDNLAQIIETTQAQVVVDFTNAEVVFANTKTIIAGGAHPVIGTSGLLAEQIQELQALCAAKHRGGIVAPNFSIGAILLMRFAAQAACYFPNAEIIEQHHPGKLDAPSATALKTADMIAKARKQQPLVRTDKELLPGARGADLADVRIHAIRLPGILADQEVLFGRAGETLSVRHHTLSRETFMAGVLLACRKVVELDTLLYGLENLL